LADSQSAADRGLSPRGRQAEILTYGAHTVGDSVPEAKELKNISAWFDNKFAVILPEMKFGPLVVALTNSAKFKNRLARYLKSMDTGIVDLGLESHDSETVSIPSTLRKEIGAGLESRAIHSVEGPDGFEWFPSRAKDHCV
jgi:hypothetical protein